MFVLSSDFADRRRASERQRFSLKTKLNRKRLSSNSAPMIRFLLGFGGIGFVYRARREAGTRRGHQSPAICIRIRSLIPRNRKPKRE
jgi:hypothetical protein